MTWVGKDQKYQARWVPARYSLYMRTLREWRAARLLTIRDLAAKANVANQTIVQIEHGRISPRLSTMRRLSEALDVGPAEISEFNDAIRRSGEPAETSEPALEDETEEQAGAPHRLQPLLDVLPDDPLQGISSELCFGFILDKHGDVLYLSPSHTRVLGDDVEWTIGGDIFDIFIQYVHPDDQYDMMRLIHHVLVTPGAIDESGYRVRLADGEWKDMRLHATNLLDNPAVEGVFLVSSPIAHD